MHAEFIKDYLANRTNPVQLVKHMDEIPENKIQYPLLGQRKYDGLYCLVIVVGGEILFYSRTGKAYYWEIAEVFQSNFINLCKSALEDGVYVTELCNDAVSLEVLAGYVSTNRKKEWTTDDYREICGHCYWMFHDYLTLDEFIDGYSAVPYVTRWDTLQDLLAESGKLGCLVQNVWVHDRDMADGLAEDLIRVGNEGAVFKQNCDWEAGHKGWRAMKIVRGLHVDLLCVGVEYGKGKRAGQIAKLKFSYKGNVFSADLGKGWTDTRRKALTCAYESGVDTTCYHDNCEGMGSNAGCTEVPPVGKIWEVKALQESSTGKALRIPKVIRVREDKDVPDA